MRFVINLHHHDVPSARREKVTDLLRYFFVIYFDSIKIPFRGWIQFCLPLPGDPLANPLRQAAVAQLPVCYRAESQYDEHPMFVAQIEKPVNIIASGKIENTFDRLNSTPEKICCDAIQTAVLGFDDAIFPFRLGYAGVLYLTGVKEDRLIVNIKHSTVIGEFVTARVHRGICTRLKQRRITGWQLEFQDRCGFVGHRGTDLRKNSR